MATRRPSNAFNVVFCHVQYAIHAQTTPACLSHYTVVLIRRHTKSLDMSALLYTRKYLKLESTRTIAKCMKLNEVRWCREWWPAVLRDVIRQVTHAHKHRRKTLFTFLLATNTPVFTLLMIDFEVFARSGDTLHQWMGWNLGWRSRLSSSIIIIIGRLLHAKFRPIRAEYVVLDPQNGNFYIQNFAM